MQAPVREANDAMILPREDIDVRLLNALRVVAVATGVVAFGAMLGAGDWTDVTQWLGLIPFGIWALAPYGFLYVMGHRSSITAREQWVVLIGASVVCLSGSAAYVIGLIVGGRGTDGTLPAVVPVAQWLGCAATGLTRRLMG
jgi:hypothetical protein